MFDSLHSRFFFFFCFFTPQNKTANTAKRGDVQKTTCNVAHDIVPWNFSEQITKEKQKPHINYINYEPSNIKIHTSPPFRFTEFITVRGKNQLRRVGCTINVCS